MGWSRKGFEVNVTKKETSQKATESIKILSAVISSFSSFAIVGPMTDVVNHDYDRSDKQDNTFKRKPRANRHDVGVSRHRIIW